MDLSRKIQYYPRMVERLAIDGGKPVLTRADYKNWPIIGKDERRLIGDVGFRHPGRRHRAQVQA
jgi:hypothetical protein